MSPHHMFLLKSSQRTLLAAVALMLISACASSPGAVSPRGLYRVTWNATRASDHAPLATASALVAPGRSTTVRTDSRRPAENTPAFPSFTVRLYGTKTADVLQLVSRASLLEATRNKKGKLKITKRNIGALLPMHVGETFPTNTPGDPVDLTVHLERANQ